MKKKLLLLIFIVIFSVSSLFSATLYSRASTGFYTSGTWSTVACGGVSCGCIPTAADNIVICTGYTVTCNTSITVGPGSDCASITIQSGGTLNMEPVGVLTVKNGGFLTINSGGNLFVDVFTNNNNSDGVVINGTLTVSSVFTNGTGADITGTGTVSLAAGSTFTNNGTMSGLVVLPIELLSFNAIPNSNLIDLRWSTASELNNDFYTIEKTKDGFDFEFVATVDGAGSSTAVLNYTAIDKHPYQGVSYYRLKQTDFNGVFKYSELVEVDFQNTSDFSFNVFPNPNNGFVLNFEITAEEGTRISFVIYDVAGREVYSKEIVTKDKGSSVYTFNPIEKLSSGIYVVKATSNQNLYSKKLIVN